MAVAKIDPKVIFASEAPAQDTPAVFTNKTVGWGESRKNGGRPTIKQSNALQQETDLKILWLNENSVTPFDATIDYPENAVTIKDGVFKILESSIWELFLDKSSVGLSNVDNTADVNKPVSTAVQTALNLKADKTYVDNKTHNSLLSRDVANAHQSLAITHANAETQKQINDYIGTTWYARVGGYGANDKARLTNGDIVKSTVDGNTNNPNSNMTGWIYATLVHERTYPPALGSPVKFMLNPSKFSLRYGLSDPLPLDNNTNMFRGLTNKDAWAEENIGGGSVAFGRNGASVAYLSTTFGHDCITYGVASTAGGAGSGTGNPDAPTDGANYGYCSFAHGKDTAAIGRISTAFGQECKASSIHSYASGMQSEAGAALASHPNGVASDGESAWAHGYRANAYGDFSFALGSFITAYNGAQIIGRGINPGSPLVNSLPDSLAMGVGVDVPTVIMVKDDGTNGGFGKLGINTKNPNERIDINIKSGDKVSISTDAGGIGALDLQGKLSNGPNASIFRVEYNSPNGSQAYGVTNFYQNGTNFLKVNELGEATFKKVVAMELPLKLSSYLTIGGVKVLGGQQPAIPNSDGTAADNARAINAILTALRSHGLIAT